MNPSPLDKVQKVLDIMRMHGIKPDDASFGMLLGNAAQRKDITLLDALMRFARREGVTLNTKLYTAAMNAYITAGDRVDYFKRLPFYRNAREIFDEMQRLGCQPNDVTYNTIIRGCATVAEAEAIWKHMQETNVQPAPRFFNSMLSILAQRGQLERLVYFTDLMRAKGVKPELQTFVSLIVGLCNARMPFEAMSYWEEMQKLGLNHKDPRVLRALYVGFGAAHKFNEAKRFGQMWQSLYGAVPPILPTMLKEGTAEGIAGNATSSVQQQTEGKGNADATATVK